MSRLSETTALVPLGPSSLASVDKRWARSISRSFMTAKDKEGCLQEQDWLSYRFHVITTNSPRTGRGRRLCRRYLRSRVLLGIPQATSRHHREDSPLVIRLFRDRCQKDRREHGPLLHLSDLRVDCHRSTRGRLSGVWGAAGQLPFDFLQSVLVTQHVRRTVFSLSISISISICRSSECGG